MSQDDAVRRYRQRLRYNLVTAGICTVSSAAATAAAAIIETL